MLLNKTLFFYIFLLISISSGAQFTISFDKTSGALNNISNPGDPNKMNWIFSSEDSLLKWQMADQDWGLGKYDVKELGLHDEKWTVVDKKQVAGNKLSFTYKTKCLSVQVNRQPAGNDYIETYTFENTTGKQITVNALDIYAPYNDNYPDAKTCATNRCNAHVWPGINASYVNALRMNGKGPHLGLVLTKGAMQSYSIANRERSKTIPWKYTASNVRGTIMLNMSPFTLAPGGKHTIQWKLFWHNGWNDFYKKAMAAGFVKLDADRYVIKKGEKLNISIARAGIKQKIVTITGDSLGEHTYRYYYGQGRKITMLNYLVVSSPDNLIDQRIHFIVSKQQMNDVNDGRYGAYMVYDNELNAIYADPKGTVSDADRDEGRERLGMGVLIAKWLQTHKDDSVHASLLRYVKFIREKLQDADYKVFSNIEHTHRHRGYNYPWVAHLYLETWKLTKDKIYLEHFYGTLRKYFKEIGYLHYSIDFRVTDGIAELEKAGMKAERDSLMSAFTKVGDFFAANGINYPSHEVNYEQSIVAPSVTFLCEMYQLTKDPKYLEGARKQMPSLEAFNGRQPDVHLNEIAIRHWDGYWFGKIPTWGDVMPHYWSMLTAVAFQKYFECTGDRTFQNKAQRIAENNLLNFKEDGRASCAYIYPLTVSGKPGKFYDHYANDQDWALVFYLQLR